MPDKVKAILSTQAPSTCKELHSFIGLVNYYQYSWIPRSNLLGPLMALTSKDVPFKWTSVHQEAFDKVKHTVACEALLAYPIFGKEDALFDIHMDASAYQLGAAITQKSKPIAHCSLKLSMMQLNYTITEQELLAIAEMLK